MPHIVSLSGFARGIGLLVLFGPFLSGCSSNRMVYPDSGRTYSVRRPIFRLPEEKPIYLGGYAGASYNPADIPGR